MLLRIICSHYLFLSYLFLENSAKTKSVLFIPRQVPGAKTSPNQTTTNSVPDQLTNKISDSSSSSSSSSSSEAGSIDLQSVLRGVTLRMFCQDYALIYAQFRRQTHPIL